MSHSTLRREEDGKFLAGIPLGIILEFRNATFTKLHINNNPAKFLGTDWIDIPDLKNFIASKEGVEFPVYVKIEPGLEPGALEIKMEPADISSISRSVRTRTIHDEKGNEAIEILDSDSEPEDEVMNDSEIEFVEVDTLQVGASESEVDYDFSDLGSESEDVLELESVSLWEKSDTVWLDEDVESFVSTQPHKVNRQVKVNHIERVTGLPSYHPVPRDDVAYLFDFSDPIYGSGEYFSMPPDAILKDKDQDSWKGTTGGNEKSVQLSIFTGKNIACRSSRLSCSGFYACECANPELLNVNRYELDPASLESVVKGQLEARAQEGDTAEKRALHFFLEIHKPSKVCKSQDSQGAPCDGHPVMQKHKTPRNGKAYFISCSSFTHDWKNHKRATIDSSVDETLLAQIFSQKGLDGFPVELVCSQLVPAHVGARIKACQYPHNSEGKPTPMKRHTCPAYRTIYVPRDPKIRMALVVPKPNRPHSHPILPATKASIDTRELYAKAARAAGLIGCTMQSVDNAPSTKIILGSNVPALVAPALQSSRLKQTIIYKEKNKRFPYGTSVSGVAHQMEFQQNQPDESERYIRGMTSTPNGGLAIFTMNKVLISLIHETDRFEVDTTFKRVHGEHKEWEIVIWCKKAQRAVTIARIYSNRADRAHYKTMFDMLQHHVLELTGKPMRFKRFTEGGNLLTMGVDMELAQVLGAGDSFLPTNKPEFSKIDTTDVKIFVQYFVRLCLTHAKRGVHDLRNVLTSEQYKRVIEFPYIKSEAELSEFTDWIRGLGIKKLQDWWDHKINNTWVLPAIIQCLSKIAPDDWTSTHATTNIGEGLHAFTNSNTGVSLSLLEAILTAQALDAKIATEIVESFTSGVVKNSRSSLGARMSRNISRHNSTLEKSQASRKKDEAVKEVEDELAEIGRAQKEIQERKKKLNAQKTEILGKVARKTSSKAESSSSGRTSASTTSQSKKRKATNTDSDIVQTSKSAKMTSTGADAVLRGHSRAGNGASAVPSAEEVLTASLNHDPTPQSNTVLSGLGHPGNDTAEVPIGEVQAAPMDYYPISTAPHMDEQGIMDTSDNQNGGPCIDGQGRGHSQAGIGATVPSNSIGEAQAGPLVYDPALNNVLNGHPAVPSVEGEKEARPLNYNPVSTASHINMDVQGITDMQDSQHDEFEEVTDRSDSQNRDLSDFSSPFSSPQPSFRLGEFSWTSQFRQAPDGTAEMMENNGQMFSSLLPWPSTRSPPQGYRSADTTPTLPPIQLGEQMYSLSTTTPSLSPSLEPREFDMPFTQAAGNVHTAGNTPDLQVGEIAGNWRAHI